MKINVLSSSILTILVICLFAATAVAAETEANERILFEKNTLYQYVAVIENTEKGERYIRNQKREIAQGGIQVSAPEKLLFEYTRMAFVALAFLDREPKDALFVGLGVAAMPKYLGRYYPESVGDIAEIDPDMLTVAQRYFSFAETDRMKVHLDDGRLFVKRNKKQYDLIFLDAYQNEYIPFHLTTVEFFKEIKSRLKEGGVVVSNVTSPYRNKFFDAMILTHRQVFPHVYIFKGEKAGNFIFVATTATEIKGKEDLAARAEVLQEERNFDIDLPELASRYAYSTEYDVGAAKVLTDDFAPVNLYRFEKTGGSKEEGR